MRWTSLLLGVSVLCHSVSNAFANKKVDVTHSEFDSGISDMQWMRSDSSVVIVLTTSGSVWRSINSGRSFVEIGDQLHSQLPAPHNNATLKFESVIVHPSSKSNAILIGKKDIHFVTQNAGMTWTPLSHAIAISNFVWHPTRTNVALFSEWSDSCKGGKRSPSANVKPCNHSLYVFQDGGQKITKVANYVVQYYWGSKDKASSANTIFYTYHRSVKSGQPRYGGWHDTVDFAATKDYGKSKKVLVKGGNKFLISRNYVFVATLSDYVTQSVNLMVSNDYGETYQVANIPTELMEKSYTILDTSEGTVMIHVNHGSQTPGVLEGNVYISDAAGLRYSLSLPNNIRSSTGECEFDRVLGLDGVYIANFRDTANPDSAEPVESNIDHGAIANIDDEAPQGDAVAERHSRKVRKTAPIIRTVISFDKGGSWDYLIPPVKDTLGNPVTCENPQRCWLHLHGITHFDRYAPFYSVESAVGLIMGTGNVGSHLSTPGVESGNGGPERRASGGVNTYISRDGGKSWNEAHKGGFIYEFGDHGGLVVMANDFAGTDQVVFSWNEGSSWYDFDLGMTDVSVDNIVIEPTSSSLEFLLYGRHDDKGAIFHLDFATLQQPPCAKPDRPDAADSDYMTWWPSDVTGSECLLGRKTKYIRKKPSSECFNGREFQREKSKATCACTKEDYYCEVGFYRPVGRGSSHDCLPSPYEDRKYMDVEGCTSSGVYYTHAWRKVPGDECVGGWTPEKVPVPCPPNSPMAKSALLSLSGIVFCGLLVGFVSYAARHSTLRRFVAQAGLDTFVDVGYTTVSKGIQRGGEELFNFWNSATEVANGVMPAISLSQTDLSNEALPRVPGIPSQGIANPPPGALQVTGQRQYQIPSTDYNDRPRYGNNVRDHDLI